jgi:hypothetical protein
MSYMRTFAASLAVLAVAQVCCARTMLEQWSDANYLTKGKTIFGHTFATETGSDALLLLDSCAIATAAAAGDFDTAASIYNNGLYSLQPNGTRLNLRTIATSIYPTTEQFVALFGAYYKDPVWIDTTMQNALAGKGPYNETRVRATAITMSMKVHVPIKYMFHDLDNMVGAMAREPTGATAQALPCQLSRASTARPVRQQTVLPMH